MTTDAADLASGMDVSGTRIVYSDRRSGDADVYVYDVTTGVETRLTTDPASQVFPRIDGDIVVWEDTRRMEGSTAYRDIYVHDRVDGTTFRASVSSDEVGGNDWSDNPSISGDGRLVVFESRSDNLVDGDATVFASVDSAGVQQRPARGVLRATTHKFTSNYP